jgi:predicted DNA-binding mobile mystery protein A
MKFNASQYQQLSSQLEEFAKVCNIPVPESGWINAIRTALGMSLQQLGRRLGVTKQAVQDMEKREKNGSITIHALNNIARVFDMEFVYGFMPKDGSLDAYIERRARELASQMVTQEGSHVTDTEQAIAMKTEQLKATMPRQMWD